MYEQVFNLTSRPFIATPFVPHYFASKAMATALAHARMCIDRGSGPVVVTGVSGTGKSLLLAMLAEQYKTDFQVISLTCAHFSRRADLLQNILFELRLPYRELSEGELRLSLIDHLKSDDCGGRGMLLLVDEAHGLSADLLDELRLITNFVRDGKTHVALVMVGFASLEDHLIETKSESFNQRIAARCHLAHLGQAETIEYVLTHVERAGGNAEELFTGEALKIIHQASDGCPRVINQVCDYAMILAASLNTPRITAEIARQAWRDVQSIPDSIPMSRNKCTGNESVEVDSEMDQGAMVIEFAQLDELDDVDERPDHSQESSADDAFGAQIEADEQIGLHRNQFAGTEDITDHENDDEFSNPFEEAFDHEETVNANWFPMVSEQNLTSLMLTPEQLSILDRLEPQAARQTAHQPDWCSISSRKQDSCETAIQNHHDADHENECDSMVELALSPEELSDLVRIEEDVRRLQLRFADSGMSDTELSSCVPKTDNQPLEELMQAYRPVQQQAVERLDSAETSPRRPESSLPEEPESRSDDRDIMIVHDRGTSRSRTVGRTRTDDSRDTAVSMGNAARMDYEDLFRQLRQAQ